MAADWLTTEALTTRMLHLYEPSVGLRSRMGTAYTYLESDTKRRSLFMFLALLMWVRGIPTKEEALVAPLRRSRGGIITELASHAIIKDFFFGRTQKENNPAIVVEAHKCLNVLLAFLIQTIEARISPWRVQSCHSAARSCQSSTS